MKKLILLMAIILFALNTSSVQAANMDFAKKLFTKQQITKPASRSVSADSDELTQSEQATLFYSENNIKSSLEVLLRIKEGDRTAQDWLLLGNIFQDQEKLSDAIFMYKRAVMVDSKCYKAYYNLGNIYLEDEKPYLAIENYRLANKANPQFAYAYYNLGCAYLRIGNLKKAKVAFLKAIDLKNIVPDFHYNMAYTYKMLNKPKLAKQYLDNYNKLIESSR